jgi:hypothetical protein
VVLAVLERRRQQMRFQPSALSTRLPLTPKASAQATKSGLQNVMPKSRMPVARGPGWLDYDAPNEVVVVID